MSSSSTRSGQRVNETKAAKRRRLGRVTVTPPLSRHARELVQQALQDTPVVVVQGARQVGKSTLLRQVLEAEGGPVLSLDEAAVQQAA